MKKSDITTIDIEAGTVSLDVPDAEIEKRKEGWVAPKPPVEAGTYIERYSKLVKSAMAGAVFRRGDEL